MKLISSLTHINITHLTSLKQMNIAGKKFDEKHLAFPEKCLSWGGEIIIQRVNLLDFVLKTPEFSSSKPHGH